VDLLQLAHDPVLLVVVTIPGLGRVLVTRLFALTALALVLRGTQPRQRASLLDSLTRFLHPGSR
jgi:hypothetical protein